MDAKKELFSAEKYQAEKNRIPEKSCLCVGLANASYLENEIKIKGQDQGVVVCPGPNMAYFDQEDSLSKMLQHIYGNASILKVKDRPNVFVKELRMYLDYFKNELNEMAEEISAPQIKKWNAFKNNLQVGIEYYQNKFDTNAYFSTHLNEIKEKLGKYKVELTAIEIPKLELN